MEDEDFECISVLHGHGGDVKTVTWHPFEELLASASYDDTVKLWAEEEDDWYCQQTLKGHTSTVWDVAFHSSGQKLVSCGADNTVIVWKQDTNAERGSQWKQACTLSGMHSRCVYSVAWSSISEDMFATGAADDAVRIFVKRSGGEEGYDQVCHEAKAHSADVNCVRWSPTCDLLASCSDDETVRLWLVRNE
mmetsp:Transcript_12615/g.32113  ORF Transcript_12615/g.32113 Transcript_12615/m.32113 type:complete len:192 (-) Transcript_12615:197-772(-)